MGRNQEGMQLREGTMRREWKLTSKKIRLEEENLGQCNYWERIQGKKDEECQSRPLHSEEAEFNKEEGNAEWSINTFIVEEAHANLGLPPEGQEQEQTESVCQGRWSLCFTAY